ncbi:hypothetical protein F5Y13DRAFT_202022 [Hypoxylon sp. FL1857]|nr:hypothetical protein F5Y13DRAFT_202022 [Hypoxylon sp. FL1857]
MSRLNLPENDADVPWGADKVHRWQTDITQEKDTQGIISQLYNTSHDLYQAFVRDLSSKKRMSKPLSRQLKSGYTQYGAWADDYGARDGRLDALLENSQRLRGFTVKILITCLVHALEESNIELRNLRQATSIATEEALRILHSTSTDSDTESETSDEDSDINDGSLKDVAEALSDEIEYLIDLGPMLEEPIPDLIVGEKPGSNHSAEQKVVKPTLSEPWSPEWYFVERVLAKFPNCDTKVATALGKANWDSLTRLLKEREAPKDGNEDSTQFIAPIPDSKTTLFQDSGLGTSIPTTNPYAATVISYLGDGHENMEAIFGPGSAARLLVRAIICPWQPVKNGLNIFKEATRFITNGTTRHARFVLKQYPTAVSQWFLTLHAIWRKYLSQLYHVTLTIKI